MSNKNTSLAVKYRPKCWEDVMGQNTVKHILKNQVDTGTFKQGYLFCGRYGSGKTTCARIFANEINGGPHDIIEIDAATYNSVDQIRLISEEARKKPLVGKYKIFIIDESHMLSQAANNAFLKILEEPPATAIFILATTDPQKMLNTILSRVQRYDFTNIPTEDIVKRLTYIASEENIHIDDTSLRYIAKLAEGGMRDAISMLDKCNSVSDNITLDKVVDALSTVSYHDHLDLLKAMIEKDTQTAVKIVNSAYESGKDMKQFMSQFMWCVCDTCNYFVFNSFNYINIPELPEYTEKLKQLSLDSCLPILTWAKDLYSRIRLESNPKNAIIVEIMLLTQHKE